MMKNSNNNATNFMLLMYQIDITPSYSSRSLFWFLPALWVVNCTFHDFCHGVHDYLLMATISSTSHLHFILSIFIQLMRVPPDDNRPPWVIAMGFQLPSLGNTGCVREVKEGILISWDRIGYDALQNRTISRDTVICQG